MNKDITATNTVIFYRTLFIYQLTQTTLKA